MSAKRNRPLTPDLSRTIVAYIRAGGWLEIAAEAAGATREECVRWLEMGEHPRAKGLYREFATAVRQALAQARLGAEVAALKSRPLDWLRNGPGRETPESPGWTGPAKPAVTADDGAAEMRELLRRVLDALDPYPEAKAALVAALEGRAT